MLDKKSGFVPIFQIRKTEGQGNGQLCPHPYVTSDWSYPPFSISEGSEG
jgi:hypothetical protein